MAPGVHIDLTEAYDSIQKIKEMADILLLLHDPSIGKRKSIPLFNRQRVANHIWVWLPGH